MSYNKTDKVLDWATDFDHGSQEYADNTYAIFEQLKNSGCPIAHTKRYGDMWIPITYDAVKEICLNTAKFSSEGTIVQKRKPYQQAIFLKESVAPIGIMPPISSDPPFHKMARGLLAPIFSADAVSLWQGDIEKICKSLIDKITGKKKVEIIENYAKKIPSTIIAKMLGIPEQDIHKFDDWIKFFINDINEPPSRERFIKYSKYKKYMTNHINEHVNNPKDNIISYLLNCKILDEPLSTPYMIGTITLLLIAGVHTVSSIIGSSLWHLAVNPLDRGRLVENPDMIPAAVEEFLRAYSPLTVARIVKEDIEFHGVQMKKEDWILLPLSSANRDDNQFSNAHQVVIDREENHHVAFGFGVHHCIGANLARLEIINSIKVFLQHFPNFSLDDRENVTWTSGQARGPVKLNILIKN